MKTPVEWDAWMDENWPKSQPTWAALIVAVQRDALEAAASVLDGGSYAHAAILTRKLMPPEPGK